MPENRGNATAYAGATTHRPLPLATDRPSIRAAHQEQAPRPTSTFDWDWNKDLCTNCTAKVPKSHLVDGVCRTCRGDIPANNIPAEVAPSGPKTRATSTSKAGQTFSTFDEADLEARYHAPSTTPPTVEPAAELVEQPDPVAPPSGPLTEPAAVDTPVDSSGPDIGSAQVSATDTVAGPRTGTDPDQATIAEAARQAHDMLATAETTPSDPAPPRRATYADLLDQQLHHTTRTLTRAHGSTDPIVGILRSAVLSTVAALDIYLELHHPHIHQTTQPVISGLGGDQPAAAPQGEGERRPATSPPPTKPRRGRGGRPKIVTTPETTIDVVRRYRDQQQSLVQIANDTGHGKALIRRILTDANIPIRPPIGRPTTLSPAQEQAVVEAYLAGQASPVVGKTYGIRADTVRDLVRAAGHQIRPRTAPGGSLNTRLNELGATSRQVKEWAVAHGVLPAVVRGSVAHAVIDAYEAAHQPVREGQLA